MANHPLIGHSDELRRLVDVRQWRLDAAAARARADRAAQEQAAREVEAGEQRLKERQHDAQQFAQYMVGEGAPDLPRLAAVYDQHRKALNDRIARAGEDLARDRDRLTEAEARTKESQREWLREQARRDNAAKALKTSRRGEAAQAERRDEEETQEALQGVRPAGTPGRAGVQPGREVRP